MRGDNDLVWVGRGANYAAKLTEISDDAATFITGEVFDRLHDSAKYGGANNEHPKASAMSQPTFVTSLEG